MPPPLSLVAEFLLGALDTDTLNFLSILFTLVAAFAVFALLFFSDRRGQSLNNPAPFRFPPRREPLPECRIRPYEGRDFEACAEIYRLNEPGRFPEGVFDEFTDWLQTSGERLTLVCESSGEIRALGGIRAERTPEGDGACLSFGMVHPDYHRRGYGEALLLARLAVLPDSGAVWAVSIFPAGGSESYYGRYGFLFTGWVPDNTGGMMKRYSVFSTASDLRRCRKILSASPVNLEADGIIVTNTTCMIRSKLDAFELTVWRDSVCAGDDADAPHPLLVSVAEGTSLCAVMELLLSARYLAQISGGQAVWVLRRSGREGRALAVHAQQWPEPLFLTAPDSDILTCVEHRETPHLHLSYHGQADPGEVLARLQPGEPLV